MTDGSQSISRLPTQSSVYIIIDHRLTSENIEIEICKFDMEHLYCKYLYLDLKPKSFETSAAMRAVCPIDKVI